MRTTIYLDIDGVLNAMSNRTPSPKFSGWDDWETTTVNGREIMYSPDMVTALNQLAELPGVTIKWLTTWEDAAAKSLSPAIGIDGQGWEVLRGDQKCWRGREWWKLQAIQADAAPNAKRGFVWIDDDISTELEAITWAKSRSDVLAISPSTVQGLTRDDVEQIKSLHQPYSVRTKFHTKAD